MHVKAPNATPMANPLLTLMREIGHEDMESFGDSTGILRLDVPSEPAAASGG